MGANCRDAVFRSSAWCEKARFTAMRPRPPFHNRPSVGSGSALYQWTCAQTQCMHDASVWTRPEPQLRTSETLRCDQQPLKTPSRLALKSVLLSLPKRKHRLQWAKRETWISCSAPGLETGSHNASSARLSFGSTSSLAAVHCSMQKPVIFGCRFAQINVDVLFGSSPWNCLKFGHVQKGQ